jgi:hypothetical protein
MSHVTITGTTLGFRVGVNNKGEIAGSPLSILEYSNQFQHKQYDKLNFRWVLTTEFFHYDPDQQMCYFPRYDLDNFKSFLQKRSVSFTFVELPRVAGAPAPFLMLPHVQYKSDIQKNAVEFLVNPASGPQRGLALQTGQGKAQPLTANILTSEGWIKMGDVDYTTKVVMPDGTLSNVVGIYPQGVKMVYRITLEGDKSTECCDEHLWKASKSPNGDHSSIVSLNDVMDSAVPLYIPVADITTKTEIFKEIKSIVVVGEKDVQCIMVEHPSNLYITDDYIVTHNTVSYIWGLQKMGKRSLTTMTSRLEQWVKEMGVYTNLDEDSIYVIQGVGSLTKLFSQIDKTIFPKVILGSSKTIRLYLEYGPGYQHLPHPSEMCERLNVGIVGTDEYHEHFYTNFLMGIMLNPEICIPITATFNATDPFIKQIFDKFVPKDMQFYGGEYKRYVNVTSYQYSGGSQLIRPFHYSSPQGYSQQRFEKFLLGKGRKVLDRMVEDALLPMIRSHYINLAEPGEKFLILCASTAMCDHLESIFKREFKDKKISVFYSGMPVTILERFDMVLSTPGSAGTGRDIKNLRTCLAFENTGSEIRNLQFIGRLRDFPSVKNTPEFIYISFTCIPQHMKYSNLRAMLYGPRGLTFRHRSIS